MSSRIRFKTEPRQSSSSRMRWSIIWESESSMAVMLTAAPSAVRTAGRVASDHARWVFVAEDLEQLGSTVRRQRVPRVFGQTSRIARPSCPADLDHHARGLVTALDLPQPATGVNALALVPAEVGADLPAVYVRR
jgi:hypothetical protein